MTYTFTMKIEKGFDFTAYWVVADGDNVGGIVPLRDGKWAWHIKFPRMDMPGWCKGRVASFEDAQVAAYAAFTRIRGGMTEAEYNHAIFKISLKEEPTAIR